MKKVTLGLFFLGEDEADDLLEAEQSGEEDGAAVDGESDDEANHPVDIQLFDKEGHDCNGDHEKDDVEPIAATHFQLEDTFGEEVLQEGCDGLYTEAGTGGTDGVKSRNDDEVEQDVDDNACRCHKVELLEATVGGEQGAEDVGRRKAEETTHEQGEHVGVLP